MLGITNSQNNTAGGGDTISAVNDLGYDISQGDKVWVRKISDIPGTYKEYRTDRYQSYFLPIFIKSDNVVFYSLGNYYDMWSFTKISTGWDSKKIPVNKDFDYRDSYRHINGEVIGYCRGQQGGSTLDLPTISKAYPDKYYVGYGLFLKTTRGSIELWTETEKICKLPQYFHDFVGGFYDGKRLFCASRDSNNYLGDLRLYDATDLKNPVLLHEQVKFTWYGFDYFTGLDVGDIAFLDDRDGRRHVAYRFDNEYNLVEVPAEDKMSNIKGTVFFDNDGKTLLIGQSTHFDLYKWDSVAKNFTSIVLPALDPKPVTPGPEDFLGALSADGTICAVSKKSDDAWTYMKLYTIPTDDPYWHTVSFGSMSDKGFSGIATGEKDEKGLDKINTLLTSKIKAVFEITPDPDTFELDGEKQ